MSRYGYLACSDCNVILWLGKALFEDDPDRPSRFEIGGPEVPLNSEKPILNKVLWKMLADHAGHNLRVLVEGEPGYTDQLGKDNIKIDGDELNDISFDDYLKNWHG